jgi:hypothetical protein
MMQLPKEAETGVEFICDAECRERRAAGVAQHAHARWLIGKSLIYQTSLHTPQAECQ